MSETNTPRARGAGIRLPPAARGMPWPFKGLQRAMDTPGSPGISSSTQRSPRLAQPWQNHVAFREPANLLKIVGGPTKARDWGRLAHELDGRLHGDFTYSTHPS